MGVTRINPMSGTIQYREIGNIRVLNECSIKLQEVFMGTDMSANHTLLCGQILIFAQFRTLKTELATIYHDIQSFQCSK